MKAIRLIGWGILPVVVGFIENWLLTSSPLGIPGFISRLLSLFLLILWGYSAFRLSDPAHNPIMQALWMCSFGLLMLILVLYQELVLGAYWRNIIGVGTQMFFLPWISLASAILLPFTSGIRLWYLYIMIWVVLFLASSIGCFKKKRCSL